MNINEELFYELSNHLTETLKSYNPHPSEPTSTHELLATEYCQTALMYCYNEIDVFKKNPLLDIIATGLYVNYMWNEIEGDEVNKFTEIYPIIENYEVKADEIIKKALLKENPEKIEKYIDLTHSILISTFNFVSENKIVLGDNGILKDSLTVFYAVFLYTCCMDGWMDRLEKETGGCYMQSPVLTP